MTRRLPTTALSVVVSIVLTVRDAVAQCAMCRQALLSPEGQQLAAALRSGILLLLAAPFATFSVIAFLAWRMNRKRNVNRLTS